ncbi:MAG: type I restriction-modification enzyme R subunit C-terminal domain-containing protein [Cellulosilyticaceae bacterium]
MTTGVDAKMCKLIVLDSEIGSMTEFKQIIGRGTRLLEDYGKTYFTIMDFRNVTRLFADPAFDGIPEVVIDIVGDEPVPVPTPEGQDGEDNPEVNDPPATGGYGGSGIGTHTDGSDGDDKPRKYYIGDVTVSVISERVQYVDKDGKLITESLIDYTKKNILNQYASLDTFLRTWSDAKKKQAIIEELKEEGVLLEAVREEIGNEELDDFDLICHLAYDKKPLTKAERANNVKKRHYLYKYSGMAQQVLEVLLDKYANDGIKEIEETKVLQLQEFTRFGSPMKIVKEFGGKANYQKAIKELEDEIYMA